MFSSAVLTSVLASVALVSAQGTVILVSGDLGGNTTSLSFSAGQTAMDTAVTMFDAKDIKTDGLGKTMDGKPIVRDFKAILKDYGATLPQVSDGGPVMGLWRADNAAGGGPLRAILDTTCTGHFSNGTELPVITQIPGEVGTIQAVGVDGRPQTFPFAFTVSRNVRCEGNDEGIAPNCMIKVANGNGYGAIFAIQQRLTGKNGELPPAVLPSYDYAGPAPYNPNPNAHMAAAAAAPQTCNAPA
ncbi:hypothetical protein P8C59_002798 [Phyllachora maydis]|uniref:Uncharacterized protein n=1 Tax=Phyllachora maydis TaxID=1825666 RepID=A0AAD9I0B5_9PEZI|nr:hypothetical protein P8C59_002798 [Phyllachora maydis]